MRWRVQSKVKEIPGNFFGHPFSEGASACTGKFKEQMDLDAQVDAINCCNGLVSFLLKEVSTTGLVSVFMMYRV